MPDGTAGFCDEWLNMGVLLPLRADPAHLGSIVDDEDVEIMVIDANHERCDRFVEAMAALVVGAVNAAGGFTAERLNG